MWIFITSVEKATRCSKLYTAWALTKSKHSTAQADIKLHYRDDILLWSFRNNVQQSKEAEGTTSSCNEV